MCVVETKLLTVLFTNTVMTDWQCCRLVGKLFYTYLLFPHIIVSPLYSNTVGRCAVFCALLNCIDSCKCESVVDVFQTVKSLRLQKPGAIQTVVRVHDKSLINTFTTTLVHIANYCSQWYSRLIYRADLVAPSIE